MRGGDLAPPDAWALAGELEAVEFLGGDPAGGDPAGGEAVAVLDPLALRARRVRALFLCGMQEGAFPSQRRRRGLLSEEDRHELERLSGLRLGRPEDPLAAERYLLYAAVSRPEELLVLSWHVADDDGLATPRSLFVEDVCDLFEEDLLERPGRAPGAGRGRRPCDRCRPPAGGRREPARRARAGRARPASVVCQLARELPRLPGALVRRAASCVPATGTPTRSRCVAAGSPTRP